MRPNIIALVGVDGAGKSSSIRRIGDLCASHHASPLFDVVPFEQQHQRLPRLDELGDAGVLLVAEPTHSPPTGTAIRHDLLRDKMSLTVPEEARRYAADRERLYQELVIPFLTTKHGWVIQSRGLICSLTYQAPRWPGASDLAEGLRYVLQLAGNQLELEYAPAHLFIFDLPTDQARKRIEGTRELDFFERDPRLQENVRSLYQDARIQDLFRQHGTMIHHIDASRSTDAIIDNVERIFHEHIAH